MVGWGRRARKFWDFIPSGLANIASPFFFLTSFTVFDLSLAFLSFLTQNLFSGENALTEYGKGGQ